MTSRHWLNTRGVADLLVAAVALASFSDTALAQNAPKVVSQRAADAIAQLRTTPGQLGDRCALGVLFSENKYVYSIYLPEAREKFVLGDRILRVNDQSVEGPQSVFYSVVGKIPPGEIARVTVERAGKMLEVEVRCANARPYTEAHMRILEAARAKNWRDCVAAIRAANELDGYPSSFAAHAYIDCGAHAGEFSPVQTPMVAYEYWRLVIEEGKWDPKAWPRTRGHVLGMLSVFEQAGHARLAAELQAQIDAADNVAARSAATGPAVPQPKPSAVSGTGTGFLVDAVGTVVTSHHVVAEATYIAVRCGQGAAVSATVSASNKSTDIAILSTDLKNTPYLSLARPRSATVGQRIFTYGFPVTEILGAEPKFTDGTISALSGIGGEQSYLQISVPVQPGNSGGPVVTETGEVVGVVAAGAAVAPFLRNTGTLPQNINWAVKAEYAALLFDAPAAQAPTSSRDEAIRRVERSLCFIEVH